AALAGDDHRYAGLAVTRELRTVVAELGERYVDRAGDMALAVLGRFANVDHHRVLVIDQSRQVAGGDLLDAAETVPRRVEGQQQHDDHQGQEQVPILDDEFELHGGRLPVKKQKASPAAPDKARW